MTALEILKWVGVYLLVPILLGFLSKLWTIGYVEWQKREERLDDVEDTVVDNQKRLIRIEEAINGGPDGDGVEGKLNDIEKMLKSR